MSKNKSISGSFSGRLIRWHKSCGRHDLPWQKTRDPYRIWLSEIMLQQTQVGTVVPYYHRFLKRFPSIRALAAAALDQVMGLWSGLGYYSRARNLHRAAQIVVKKHGGRFPKSFDWIAGLPGIGRSTAGAISVFAFGERRPILDGNVKRVLARFLGIDGFPGEPAVAENMWKAAEGLLPRKSIETYTQALMDLGATVCTRKKPLCERCPQSRPCVARKTNRAHLLPTPRERRDIPRRSTHWLLLQRNKAFLLVRRPPTGVWGGLWSFPEVKSPAVGGGFLAKEFGLTLGQGVILPAMEHAFTHFSLTLIPWLFPVRAGSLRKSRDEARFFEVEDALTAGIPAPVRRLLEALKNESVQLSMF